MFAVSIKLNEPVVVSTAPTPLATPFGCVYVIVPLVAVASVVDVAANTGVWKANPVVTNPSTYNLLTASPSCCGCGTLLIYSLLALILPVALKTKSPVETSVRLVPTTLLVLTLPLVILALVVIFDAELIALNTLPLKLNPTALTFELV